MLLGVQRRRRSCPPALLATPRAAAPGRPPPSPLPCHVPSSTHRARRAGGSRAYIAIAGGLDVPDYLGSKSTFPGGAMGGHQGRALRPGDMLFLGHAGEIARGGAELGAMAWTGRLGGERVSGGGYPGRH